MSGGKRIGFVDYKLDNFHANVFLKIYRGLKGGVCTVAGAHALDEENGRAWAKKNDVAYFSKPEELNANVDVFMILAPSNPEVHLDLCRKFVPFGKTTYVDKTFAPDLKTAREIFELADQHGVALQTSSALRYTDVQKTVDATLKHMTAWGGGSSFAEYAIHPVEMVISCMGAKAESMMRRGSGKYSQLLINFDGERTATVNVYTGGDTPFAAMIANEKSTHYVPANAATLFENTAIAILDFFIAGKPTVDRAESLMIRRILDVAEDPKALREFVKLTGDGHD